MDRRGRFPLRVVALWHQDFLPSAGRSPGHWLSNRQWGRRTCPPSRSRPDPPSIAGRIPKRPWGAASSGIWLPRFSGRLPPLPVRKEEEVKNEKEPQASRQAQLPSSPSPFPISYTYSYSTPSPYRRADDGHVTDICLTHVRHLTDKRQFFLHQGQETYSSSPWSFGRTARPPDNASLRHRTPLQDPRSHKR